MKRAASLDWMLKRVQHDGRAGGSQLGGRDDGSSSVNGVKRIMPLRGGADRGAAGARVGGELQLQHLPPDRRADGLLPAGRGTGEGETTTYLTGDPFMRLHHWPVCGCHTH
jgi:hypothetical protein